MTDGILGGLRANVLSSIAIAPRAVSAQPALAVAVAPVETAEVVAAPAGDEQLLAQPAFVARRLGASHMLSPAQLRALDNQDLTIEPAPRIDRAIIASPFINWNATFLLSPLPRAQMTAPLATSDPPVDTALLEDPADPSKHYWIPRYRLTMLPAPAGQGSSPRPQIAIEQQPDGSWTFTAVLEQFPAPELGDVSTATPIDHTVTLALRYQAGPEQKELSFEPATLDAGRLNAVMKLPDVNQRDLLVEVLSNADHDAKLIVRRVAEMAVPAGTNENGEQLYREATQTVDAVEPREPFAFDRDTYGWLYSQVGDPTHMSLAAQLRWVTYGDRQHRYYQDPINPEVFSHLPDAFKIGRREQVPRTPAMVVRLAAAGDDPEAAQVTLEYLALPVTDPQRLIDAASALAQYVPAGRPPISFRVQQVAASRMHFSVTLPRTATSAATAASEATAPDSQTRVDVRSGIADVVTMTMPDFRTVFEALCGGGSPVLFQGQLELQLGDTDGDVEQIPFVARMNDLVGQLLSEADAPVAGGDAGSVDVTLTNAIESPVRVAAVTAELLDPGGGFSAATVDHDAGPEPITLAPAEQLKLHVHPSQPPAAGAPADAVLSFGTLVAVPDPTLEWAAILDPAAPAYYTKTIPVRGTGQFDPPPGGGADPDPVIAVLVEFEHGSTVELTPDHPDGDGTVQLPLAGFVLNAQVDARYRYRVRVIHHTARPPASDWMAETMVPLYPVVA